MYSRIWKSPLIILLFLGCKAISVAGANNCSDPGTPTNGQRSLSNTTNISVVTYSCDDGYTLQGSNSRTCQSNGQWNGSMPKCNDPFQVTGVSLEKATREGAPSLWVTWTAPQHNVNISAYDVQYKIEGSTEWSNQVRRIGSVNKACVISLKPGTEYNVRVKAMFSDRNIERWSIETTERTYDTPSRISNITLTKRVNNGPALEANWTIPQTDLAIFQYKVQYRRRGTTVWDTVTIRGSPPLASTILNELHAGTEYSVRVQAVSAAGDGMWSAVQTKRTYKSPSRISTVFLSKTMLKRYEPSLNVTWTEPKSELGISKYHVEYRKSEDTEWIPGPILSHSMTFTNLPALTAGTVYSVRVKAVSAVGAGSWSNVQTERTYKFPSQISRISLTKATGNETPALRVNWTSPQSEVAIFQYCVQYRKSEDTHWKIQIILPPATFADITDLDAGTAYSVRVRAVSDVGAGNWSEVQTKNTYDPPSRISSISVTKAVENMRPALRVNWTTPQSNFVILRYKVQYKIQSSRAWGDAEILVSPPATSTILTRLEAGTRYSVRVKAMSNIGEGIWSMAEINTTYRLPPHPNHDNVSAVPVDRRGAIRVSWTAPTVPRGELPVTGYSIQYKVGTIASNITTLMVQTSPAEVTGLLPGTEYRVLVASVNALGTGEYCCNTSTTVHVRTHKATPQPIVPLANSTLQSLSISWSVMSPQDLTNYMVFWWKESAEISKSVALDDTKFVIEGLLSNTAYHVMVLASGPLGNVNSTSEVFYTAPKEVQGSLSVLVLPAQILQVSWKPPEDAGRSAIEYIVNTTTGMELANSTSIKHPITSVPISGLPQYSSGTVSVWAKNPGAMSKPVVSRFRMVNIVTNVSGVSAEWVNDSFTSLRVSLPGGSTYRITYTSVSERNATEPKTVTTSSISHVVKDFRPDWFYTILVEAVTLDSDEAMNGNIGIVGGNNAATVGAFLGGLVAGGISVVLLEGIVLGLVKLRKQRKGAESTEEEKKTEATYETVGPKESAALNEHVAMETNPAYASVQ